MPDIVLHCSDYHPFSKGGQKNPLFNNDSKRLLDFKDAANTKHAAAVNFFCGRVKTILNQNKYGPNFFDLLGIVPSSSAGRHSPGLVTLLNNIGSTHQGLSPTLINRMISVVPSHAGGPRDPQIHIRSLAINGIVKDKNILLIDDVVTSGSIFSACCSILKLHGAKNIVCIALARTI